MQGGSLSQRKASTEAELVDALQTWAQRLNVPRVRSTRNLCIAEWQPSAQLALVTREKGSDLHAFGVYSEGRLYLRPAEALCLLEDGLLLLLHNARPLSVHEAYVLLFGPNTPSLRTPGDTPSQTAPSDSPIEKPPGQHTPLDPRRLCPDVYATFCALHRNGFVSRPHALLGEGSDASPRGLSLIHI